MKLDWESADGDVLQMRITDHSQYVFIDVTGLGNSPDSDILTQRSPWQHGQTTMRCLPFGREIKFILAIRAPSYEELQNRRRTIGRIFSPVSKSGGVNAGTLTITLENGSVYTIVCVSHGAAMPAGPLSTRGPRHQLAQIYLVADDPYFYGAGQSQAIVNGANVVANGGNVQTGHTLSVTGPASPPSISTVQGGVTIPLNFLDPIASGFRLDISSGFGAKSAQLVEVAVPTNVVDVFTSLTPASRFFDLLVGNNTLTYAGGGTASLSWAHRYQTIL